MRAPHTLRWLLTLGAIAALAVIVAAYAGSARAVAPYDDQEDGLVDGAVGTAMQPGEGAATASGQPGNPQSGVHDNGRGGNTYVNDPCLDPPPPNRAGTVQSETELATYGKYIVVGYNDSLGFYDNTQGLSGYAYSVDGGNTFIDGGGLPPIVRDHSPLGTPGSDHYAGDPVLVADQRNGTFYYASIYFNQAGVQTLSVNSGHFATAPPQTTESRSDTRCLNDTAQQGAPNTKPLPKERIVWNPPVQAVSQTSLCGTATPVPAACDALDKEWLTIDQKTGELYLTYTRFGADGSTPIELVRSKDGGATWEGPFVIVPNLNDTFNQATQPIVTVNPSTGSPRITVTWNARTFSGGGLGPESENRIESAFSDDDGTTWSTRTTVATVNPQGEPAGYNRGRRSILNAPYINVDPNAPSVLYDTYFDGKTPLQTGSVIYTGPLASAADILISKSVDGGTTWLPPVKVNDDAGTTSHVFPSVQIDKHSFVYVAWLDRRFDPANVFTDLFAAVSKNGGATFGHNQVETDIATTWYVRADARPNMGDYNSSELLNGNQFVTTWADGRFKPPYCTGTESFCNAPAPGSVTRLRPATPDTMFTIANGLGVGNG